MTRVVLSPPDRRRQADGRYTGGWWHATDEDRLVCDLCPRACSLKPGDRGFCFVRENHDGRIVLSTYGRSTGFCIDPIEKKPLNHFLPGTAVLSFGTAGCNLGCKFCQNWDISKSREVDRAGQQAEPATIARAARELGCHSVAFTYNDPVIWAEYAIDTALACHESGVKTVAVTAGYIAAEARGAFFKHIDAANVDLKAFNEPFYRELAYGHLQPVLDTLVWLKRETNVWFELTNLIIPDANDGDDELRRMCDWITEHLGDEVPVHFTAFHPDFRMRDRPATALTTLLTAYEIACRQGIKYPYVGNVHDPRHDSTYCPGCGQLLIERNWHLLGAYHLRDDRCPSCDHRISGHFLRAAGTWGGRRLPVRIADYVRIADSVPPPAVPIRPSSEQGVADKDDESVEREMLEADMIPTESADSATEPASNSNVQGDTPMNATPNGSQSGAEQQMPSPPCLSADQDEKVIHAAAEFVLAGLQGRPPRLEDPSLAGAAEMTVMGAFVTLKRQRHLRACCGSLGRPMRLIDALREAAFRTALEDHRLPPISLIELAHLSLDVSLLHNFQDVPVERRSRQVEVGRHGLTIHRGQSGGLLLPIVPVEQGWDSQTFLRQVCRKANLPTDAWQDARARLQTFEAHYTGKPMSQCLRLTEIEPPPPKFGTEQLQRMAEHCRANVQALCAGATPNYYMADGNDATVQGVAMTAAIVSQGLAPQFGRLSIRPGLPLQATLFQLSETAARWFNEQNLPQEAINAVQISMSVLYDSALHGTLDAPDLSGLNPKRRALLVMDQGRHLWHFDPNLSAEELLQHVTGLTDIQTPHTASLISLEIDSTAPACTVSDIPRPQEGGTLRRSAVAGTFYPSDAKELSATVDRLLDEASTEAPESDPKRWPAVMVPHAGLKYSGRIAAQVFQQVEFPSRAVIFAPKHTRLGARWAVAPHETWSLPGMSLPSDPTLARQLAAAVGGLELDAAAHRDEHAVEIELPLLARLAPTMRTVGVVVGPADWDHCRRFADELAGLLETDPDPPLLIISSDMNHFASDSENRRLDEIALEAVQSLDPQRLFQTVREHNISMCGVLPAVIVMQTLKNLGRLKSCRQVAYATSADVSHDSNRVVGYAGMLFGPAA